MPISVSIIEDNVETSDNLVALLNADPRVRCLQTYPNGEEALRRLPAEKPEVVLVDIRLPGMSGIECVSELKLRLPDLQILMLTTYEETDLIFDSLRAGASGYLLKETPTEELIHAIEQVHAGGAPMSMQIARRIVDHYHQIREPASEVDRLSPREQEILGLLAKGYLYKEIVDELGISLSTVRTHLKRIYEKLHVQTRTEATAKFLSRK